MDHKTEVGLVEAHAERGGRHQRLDLVALQCVLGREAIGRIGSSGIGKNPVTRRRQHGRRGKTQQVGAGHPFVRHKKRRRPEQHGGSGHTESRHHQRAHDAGCQDEFCHRSHQPPHHAGAETGSVALHFVYIHIGITRPTPENCPMTRPTRPTHSIFNFNFLVKIRGFYKFAGTVKMLCIHCIIFNNF